MTADHEAARTDLGELTVRIFDRGDEPEYHKDRRLFGPWQRYEAQLEGLPAVRAVGWSAFDALLRLVSNHRVIFDGRWPAVPLDGAGGPKRAATAPLSSERVEEG